jgi:hypothetical protein
MCGQQSGRTGNGRGGIDVSAIRRRSPLFSIMRSAPAAIVAPCSTNVIVRASPARTCARRSRTSRNRPAGTTITPSASPTITSPASTWTSPSVTGAPTMPGPFIAGEFGWISGCHDPRPVAREPVGNGRRDTFVRHHPGGDVAEYGGAGVGVLAPTITSPGSASDKAPNMATMSAG